MKRGKEIFVLLIVLLGIFIFGLNEVRAETCSATYAGGNCIVSSSCSSEPLTDCWYESTSYNSAQGTCSCSCSYVETPSCPTYHEDDNGACNSDQCPDLADKSIYHDWESFVTCIDNSETCTSSAQDQCQTSQWCSGSLVCTTYLSNPEWTPTDTLIIEGEQRGKLDSTACNDGIDNDCNGKIDCQDSDCQVDVSCPSTCPNDADGDNYAEYDPTAVCDGLQPDCNDNDPLINPGAIEDCDGVDNDCDAYRDEGCATCVDADSDNDYGSGDEGTCSITEYDCNDDNFRVNLTTTNTWCDCDNTNGGGESDGRRSEYGLCSDGVDNDCDGLIDIVDPDCTVSSCTFDSAQWGATSVNEGTNVQMIVMGTNCLDGLSVVFDVGEADGTGTLTYNSNLDGVDTAIIANKQFNMSFEGGQAVATWPSQAFLETNWAIDEAPEFVFRASLQQDMSKFIDESGILEVLGVTTGNPDEYTCTSDGWEDQNGDEYTAEGCEIGGERCCADGYRCESDECVLNDGGTLCSYYSDPTSCNDDIYDFWINTLRENRNNNSANIGMRINYTSPLCYSYINDAYCDWNSTLEGGKCTLKEVILSETSGCGGVNPETGTCITYEVGEEDTCEDGILTYRWQSYWEGVGTPTEEECPPEGASAIECYSGIQLPFFGNIQILISLLTIGLIYFIFRKND